MQNRFKSWLKKQFPLLGYSLVIWAFMLFNDGFQKIDVVLLLATFILLEVTDKNNK